MPRNSLDSRAQPILSYDRLRRLRTRQIARRSAHFCRVGQQLTNPVAVALRNMLVRITPSAVALQLLARQADWHAPVIPLG